MRAVLRSEVQLLQIAVVAEVALWERRPELQLLCAAAVEHGALGLDEIGGVLPGLSVSAQKNLLRHLSYLRLVDGSGRVTALGHTCAADGLAPSWELGGYTFLVSNHPLLRCHILRLQRTNADGRDWDFRGLANLPEWFRPDPGRVWRSAFDDGTAFTVSALPAPRGTEPRCRVQEMGTASLEWSIDVASGENSWQLQGQIRGERGAVNFRSRPESAPVQELAGSFAGWDPRWDDRLGRLAMAYDGGAKDGVETFLRSFRYPMVQVGPYGSYRDVVVEGVPVGPKGATEAREWALALSVARVGAADAYVSKETWTMEWQECVAGTPLEREAAHPPEPKHVAQVGGRPLPDRLRWLFAAPGDLAME